MHKYLIDFKNSVSYANINSYLASIDAIVLQEYDAFEKVFLIESKKIPKNSSIIENIIDDDSTEIQLLSNVIVSDPTFGKIVNDGTIPIIDIVNEVQNWWKYYSLVDPDLDSDNYLTNRRGKDSVIYLMDGGVDSTHSEFEASNIINLFTFNGTFTDTSGHGTALASVMIGKTCGLSDATVKSVKIFDKTTPTKQSDIINALNAIYMDYRESNASHFIVNMSWSIEKNKFIEDKIIQLMKHGIFFVAAAGNNGLPIENVTPASMAEILTIGSYNQDLIPSDFSNYTGGSEISYTANTLNYGELDGFAPGEKIWAALPNNSYGYIAGTSVSAAIQSAALAYNFSTGYIPPLEYVDVSAHIYHRQAGLGRRNLLDLTNSKFVHSNNQITTFFDTRPNFGKEAPILTGAKIESGAKITLQFFNPRFVNKIEIMKSLPDNMTISNIGKMYWVAPEINTAYETYVYPIKIWYNDNSVEETTFTLVVVSDTFDPTNSDLEDRIVNITMLANCTSFGCTNDTSCTNDCSLVTCNYYVEPGCSPLKYFCGCDF